VLAVGDAEFQRRCLGKLETVGNLGRTVVFVSHNMAAVLRLCPRAILLDHGRMVADGPAAEVTAAYLDAGLEIGGERCWPDPHGAPGDDVVRLRAVRVLGPDGNPTTTVDIQQPFTIEIEYWNLRDRDPLVVTAVIRDAHGLDLFSTRDNLEPQWGNQPRPAGLYRSVCTIPGNFLNSGRITVDAAVSHRNLTTWHAWEQSAVAFDVVDTGGVRGDYQGPWPGAIRPYLQWVTRLEESVAAPGAVAGRSRDGVVLPR
jgi:lipopolysaccharide transport system ATP-binding protein